MFIQRYLDFYRKKKKTHYFGISQIVPTQSTTMIVRAALRTGRLTLGL